LKVQERNWNYNDIWLILSHHAPEIRYKFKLSKNYVTSFDWGRRRYTILILHLIQSEFEGLKLFSGKFLSE